MGPTSRDDEGRGAAGRRPVGLALLLLAGVASPGLAATLQGVVLDPQDRVVVGAIVSLTCGAATDERWTDGRGEFRFDRPGELTGCTIGAVATGFAPSRAQPAGRSTSLVVRLQLPMVNESLTVRPQGGEVGLSPYRSLASASIPAPELRAVSDDTGDLLRYARARAGLTRSTEGRVYVDGLPAGVLPPADTIDRIVVDGDPFSAEYGEGTDGHIDIATLAPDRKLRLRLGGGALGAGGGSVLDPRAGSRSRSWSVGLSGPVPHLPLSFAIHSSLATEEEDVPIRASLPAGLGPAPPTASVAASSGSVQLALAYSRGEATRARVSFFDAHGHRSGVGLSGITLPEAGMSLRSDARELRATFTTGSAGLVHRAGLVGSWSASAMTASSLRPGVTVSGAWIGGGAEAAALDLRGSSWSAKYVVQARPGRRYWSAGAMISRISDEEEEVVNPAGHRVFETAQAFADAEAGLVTGTWFGARGDGRTAYVSTVASPFVEVDLLESKHLRLRSGLRADYQTDGGTLLSPRLSGVVLWRGYTLRWGGGIFVRSWATGVLLQAIEKDSAHLDRFLAQGSSPAVPIDSRIASDLTRPRDLVLRASVERRRGGLSPGIEYTWTRATHRLGSQRLALRDGFVDTLESNRFARKHQLHASLQAEAKGQRLGVHYQWTRSRDDTDGPYSFPESPDHLGAEAARSAGIAPHELSVVASLRLPADVSLTLIESYHSSAPYNVTSGADPAGTGLYNSRDGRPRNSGNGPGYHSTSLHCSRRIALPVPGGGSGQKAYANVSVHVENLLNDRNVLALGGVAGSPLFGVPLAALPGRSLRLSVSVDR